MRDSHPQALFDVLEGSLATSSNTLQTIQRNAKAIIKLNRAVKGLLPAEIKPMCRVANYRNSIMVIEVANARCAIGRQGCGRGFPAGRSVRPGAKIEAK